GTMPVMLSTGWLAGSLIRFDGISRFGRLIAAILILFGILNLSLLSWKVHTHHGHEFSNLINGLLQP
ncbi:MAG: hypothetical protein HQL86_09405, partial [Magnetococcales bacterium]|nr:hypothetical protein [Magnetococcales bacterium]